MGKEWFQNNVLSFEMLIFSELDIYDFTPFYARRNNFFQSNLKIAISISIGLGPFLCYVDS